MPQTNLPLVSSPSRAQLSARCQRRGFVQNVLGYRSSRESTEHLDFGSVLHVGAAEWWKTGDEDRALARAYEEFGKYSSFENSKLTVDLALFMLRYYFQDARLAGGHWASKSASWELLQCEERVIEELSPAATLAFQLDRLVINRDTTPPLVVLVDLKTTSRLTKTWERQWSVDYQQRLYHALVKRKVQREFGVDLAGHYVEGLLKKVPTELRYVQVEWSDGVLDEALVEFERRVQRDAALVAQCQLPEGEFDLDRMKQLALEQTSFNTADCFAYGRPCELIELCLAEPAQRVGLLNDGFHEVELDFY